MKPSTELLIRIMGVMNAISPQDESLDDLSREIFLMIAEADANNRNHRVSDVVSISAATAPTIYGRLKNLIEMDLVESKADPKDARAQLLYLTPMGRSNIKKAAKEINQICRA